MSDSDNSGKDVDFSDFENIDGSNNLAPYQFEPTVSANKERIVVSAPTSEVSVRKGNTSWCSCGKCKRMEAEEESLCCREEVPNDYFGENISITEHENFPTVCLHREVLRTTLVSIELISRK